MALNLEQSSGLTAQFGNAVFANSAAANALVRLPDGPGAAVGDEIEVLLLD